MTKHFLKTREFWISTGIFLIVSGAIAYFVLPPLFQTYQTQKRKMNDLNAEIAAQTQYIATIKSLNTHPETIDSLFVTANELLPTNLQSDLLALQLDGLLASLNMPGLNVTVPFATAGLTSPSVTLAGSASFTQAEQLIAGLKSFGRWNKITSIDIAQTSKETTITITTSVFSRTTKPPEFTGSNTKLLVQASQLFNSFKSYSTVPNVTQEGQYGRSDPFATP